jgi:hypothetical protein
MMSSKQSTPGAERPNRPDWEINAGDDRDKRMRLTQRGAARDERKRTADWFVRRQRAIPLEKRKWLNVVEVAEAQAKIPGTLDIDGPVRDRFIDAVRRSILSNEFTDELTKRSMVINVMPHGHGEWRFDPNGAAIKELFNPIAEYIWMSRPQWTQWLDRLGLEPPARIWPAPVSDEPAVREALEIEQATNEPSAGDPEQSETIVIRSGLKGRPNSSDIVFREVDLRIAALKPGEFLGDTKRAVAKSLCEWLDDVFRKQHPEVHPLNPRNLAGTRKFIDKVNGHVRYPSARN